MTHSTLPPSGQVGRLSFQDFEFSRSFKDEVLKRCKPGSYNLVLHKHLGDIVYAIGTKKEFDRRHQAPLRFIVRPQHEFMMSMFGILDYSVFDIDALVKKNDALKHSYFGTSFPQPAEIDRLENDLFQALFSCIPRVGEPFVCESTALNDFFSFNKYWAYRWAANMGLHDYFRFSPPVNWPQLSDEAKRKLSAISSLDKIVIFAPEAATAAELPTSFWNVLANAVHDAGYKIILNSNRYNINYCISAFDLDLSLKDIVALSYECRNTFSLRSGFCDVVAGIGDRLYTFYPSMLRREANGLNKVFKLDSAVNEIVISKWKIEKTTWEGIDLTTRLQRIIDKIRLSYIGETFRSALFPKHRLARSKARRRALDEIAGAPKRFPDNNVYNPPSHDRQINFMGITLYKKTYEAIDEGSLLVRRSFLSGLYHDKKHGGRSRHIFLFGAPLFTRTRKREDKIKIFGTTIRKRDLSNPYISRIFGLVDPKYDDIYIFRYHIGETYVYLAHLANWIAKEGSRNPAIVTSRESHIPLIKMFLPEGTHLLHIPLNEREFNYIVDRRVNFDGRRLLCNERDILQKLAGPDLGMSEKNFYDFILRDMGLPRSAPLAPPRPSKDAEITLRDKLRAIEFDTSKYVFLIPEATSLSNLKTTFWDDLCEALIGRGYQIFANCTDQRSKPWGAKSIDLSLEEAFVLAQSARGIIGLASGLGVLLSAAGVPMDLIYSDLASGEHNSTTIKSVYSISSIPRTSSNPIREYDLSHTPDDEIKREILERY